MRFLHLADLHIGKRVNEFSMIEDQRYILNQILDIVKEQEVQCVLIAGDIYDKAVPSAEAVLLLDQFISRLAEMNVKVVAISGNHDSPERIGFGAEIMSTSGVYMSHPFNGNVEKVTLEDECGPINIYMLPFIKPTVVRPFFQEEDVSSYDRAMEIVINSNSINKDERNVLLAHQFVKGGSICESEEVSIGGVDQVSADYFENFDYVGLGHLHGPQTIGRETVRYAGTPLKYSFSEVNHKKSALIFDLKEKGNIEITKIPFKPIRDMKEIKGTYDQITARDFYKDMNTQDYYHITLTDEEDVPEAIGKLRTIYPNIMRLDYDNTRTRTNNAVTEIENIELKSPLELFKEFYVIRNNQDMSPEQEKLAMDLIEKIWEDA